MSLLIVKLNRKGKVSVLKYPPNDTKPKYPNYKAGQRVWLWGDIRAKVIKNAKYISEDKVSVQITENFKGLRNGDTIVVNETRKDPQMRPREWGQRRGEY